MQSIFSIVPWLKPFLEWALAIFVALIILAAPFYYLLLPSARRFRSGMAGVLQRLRDKHEINRADRQARFEDYLSRFKTDCLLRHLNASLHRFWLNTKSLIADRTSSLADSIASSKSAFDGFTRTLPRLQEGFAKNLETVLPKELEQPTFSPELLSQIGNLIVARVMFVVTLLFILILITVNTGMLGQILRDLGFIPPTLKLGSIPIYLLFSCFITCVEAGLGLIHGIKDDAELAGKKPFRVPIGAWLAIVGGICLACVEGFFYSRIISSRTEKVTIPLINFEIPQSDLMFIWGFVLVMVLFGLGHICYSMFTKAARGTAPTLLRRQVKSINRLMHKWTEKLRSAEAALNKVRSAATAANDVSASEGSYARLEALIAELKDTASGGPEWARIIREPLDLSAVLQMARHALLWLSLTVAVAAVAVFTGYVSFGFLGDRRVLLLAVAQCCVFVIGGLLLAWHETVEDGESQKIMAPIWARISGCILLAAAVIGYIVAFIYYGGSPLIWFANLLVLAGVAAASYQVLPLVGLLPIWGHRLLMIVIRALEFVLRMVVGVVLLVAIVIEEIVSIIAKPIELIFGRKAQPQRAALIVETKELTAPGESK